MLGFQQFGAPLHPIGRGPGALSMSRRANRAPIWERTPGEHDGPTRQPGQGNRRGAQARAAPQAVGEVRHLLHRGGRAHHRRHRRLQVLRVPPHRGRRGGRRPLHRRGPGSRSGQEGRGAEGAGRGRGQRARRLCRARPPAAGGRRPGRRQNGAGGWPPSRRSPRKVRLDPLLADYARLQAATLRLDSANWTEMQNRLNDLAAEGNAWRFSARELLGLAAQKAGKTQEARTQFQLLLERSQYPAEHRRAGPCHAGHADGGGADERTTCSCRARSRTSAGGACRRRQGEGESAGQGSEVDAATARQWSAHEGQRGQWRGGGSAPSASRFCASYAGGLRRCLRRHEHAGACPRSTISIPGRKSRCRCPASAMAVIQQENIASNLSGADKPILLPPQRENAAWSQPGGVASNAPGHLAFAGAGKNAWSADAGTGSSFFGRLTASPIVYDDKVYTLDAAGKVSAFGAVGRSPGVAGFGHAAQREGPGRVRRRSGGGRRPHLCRHRLRHRRCPRRQDRQQAVGEEPQIAGAHLADGCGRARVRGDEGWPGVLPVGLGRHRAVGLPRHARARQPALQRQPRRRRRNRRRALSERRPGGAARVRRQAGVVGVAVAHAHGLVHGGHERHGAPGHRRRHRIRCRPCRPHGRHHRRRPASACGR